jgi:hypothetical protein
VKYSDEVARVIQSLLDADEALADVQKKLGSQHARSPTGLPRKRATPFEYHWRPRFRKDQYLTPDNKRVQVSNPYSSEARQNKVNVGAGGTVQSAVPPSSPNVRVPHQWRSPVNTGSVPNQWRSPVNSAHESSQSSKGQLPQAFHSRALPQACSPNNNATVEQARYQTRQAYPTQVEDLFSEQKAGDDFFRGADEEFLNLPCERESNDGIDDSNKESKENEISEAHGEQAEKEDNEGGLKDNSHGENSDAEKHDKEGGTKDNRDGNDGNNKDGSNSDNGNHGDGEGGVPMTTV